MRIGTKIDTLMQRRSWSQSELARRAGVGQTTVSRLIANSKRPAMDTIERIARALGVAVNDLVDDSIGLEQIKPDYPALVLEWVLQHGWESAWSRLEPEPGPYSVVRTVSPSSGQPERENVAGKRDERP